MNIDTHFDYNNHITFISTHTNIGTPHEKVPVAMQTKVNLLIRLFECKRLLSPVSTIVTKLLTRDEKRNLGNTS